MGNNESDDAKATGYFADTVRWALILGIVGIIIKFGAFFASNIMVMMWRDGAVNTSEFAVLQSTVIGVLFVGNVLVMAGFVGLARKHGSALGWIFLATWLVSIAWSRYVFPVIVNTPYYGSAAFVMSFAITLANSYVLWTIRKSTVHPTLTIALILDWLLVWPIASVLSYLLLEWIWPYESGTEFLFHFSVRIFVSALTSILTILLFVVEMRRLNQAKHLESELQSLSP